MIPTPHCPYCPYCNKPARLMNSTEIFNLDHHIKYKDRKLWACIPCMAWVGCHKGTARPLGGLADRELRKARVAAHKAFDDRWRGRPRQARKDAYSWLASRLEIKHDDCHIGWFDLETCKKVVRICAE